MGYKHPRPPPPCAAPIPPPAAAPCRRPPVVPPAALLRRSPLCCGGLRRVVRRLGAFLRRGAGWGLCCAGGRLAGMFTDVTGLFTDVTGLFTFVTRLFTFVTGLWGVFTFVSAGCRGWLSGLVAPIRYYGGFPPRWSLVGAGCRGLAGAGWLSLSSGLVVGSSGARLRLASAPLLPSMVSCAFPPSRPGSFSPPTHPRPPPPGFLNRQSESYFLVITELCVSL